MLDISLTSWSSFQVSVIKPKANQLFTNRPRSIYQYSNMARRLSGQNSIFGVVFFVSKSLLGIEGQKKLEKFAILTRKVLMLIKERLGISARKLQASLGKNHSKTRMY